MLRVSILQKTLISLLSVVLRVIWLFDYFASNKTSFLKFVLSCFLTFFIGFTLLPPVSKNIIDTTYYLYQGFIYETNGYIPLEPSTKVSKYLAELERAKNIPYPKSTFGLSTPNISAQSALVIEREKNKILFELNKDIKLPPASTTKVLTALVAKDIYSSKDILEVPAKCLTYTNQHIGLTPGDQLRAFDLIKGMLIYSGGDAACTLANGKSSESEFIEKMNQKAMLLGMKNSSFNNPIGLDSNLGDQYSSAYDLYLMSQALVKDETLYSMVQTKEDTIKSVNGIYTYYLRNTNALLWNVPNSVGIKTGRTEGAKEVLIYENKDSSKDLIIIVMGSDNRFNDTEILLNWALESFVWE